MEKKLGKIESVYFGIGGYQNAMIGIHFSFSMKGSGVGNSMCAWDCNQIKWSKNCKWTEQDRSNDYDQIVRFVSGLLHKAKVKKVEQLKDIPVEITFEGNHLKSWRILEEVI